MRIIFACAGSGGHVNPAIAIADMIVEKYPDSEILFIGTKSGLENDIIKDAGFDIEHIRTGKLYRELTFRNVKELTNSYLGISDSRQIIKKFKPDLIIGTGGYICVSVMVAAKRLKVPYILHESNAFPGLAIKLHAKKAAKVMVGFEDAKQRLKNRDNIVYTGSPTRFSREDILKLDKQICKKNLELGDVDKKIILVMCGSQGAKKVNETILNILRQEEPQGLFFVLITGNKNYKDIYDKLNEIKKEVKYNVFKYIKLEKYVYDMEKMYKVADLCITRAGAMTLTELATTMKPAITIPLPSAAENHQYYNAKVLEEAGAGVLIVEKDLNTATLKKAIYENIKDINLEKMSKNAEKLIATGVKDKILSVIEQIFIEK